jgi:Bacterial PH domain
MTANEPITFRSTTAVIVWVLWLLFAVANWVDLAVQGRDHTAVVAAAVLLLATGVAYVTAQRPRVIADDAGIAVRNPLRDHRIGWAGVVKVDLADLLRVHCDWSGGSKVITAWAVHYSRRRQMAAEVKARRNARRAASGQQGFGALNLPYGGARGLRYAASSGYAASSTAEEAEAERTVRLLSERATAARAEAVWADGTAGPSQTATTDTLAPQVEPLTSTWSVSAIAAVLIPALILLVVCLV